MPKYAVYQEVTGEISRILTLTEDTIDINVGDSEQYAELDDTSEIDDLSHYVAEGELVPRPFVVDELSVSLAADGVDAWSLSVPDGTRAQLQGNVLEEVEGGQIIFTTVYPGTYTLIIEPPFPFQRQEVTINAD